MDFDDVIRTRRSIRGFLDRPVPRALIAEILELAQVSVASLNLSTIYRHLNALQDDSRIAKVMLPGQPLPEAPAAPRLDDSSGHVMSADKK